jgi:hypothetical protein
MVGVDNWTWFEREPRRGRCTWMRWLATMICKGEPHHQVDTVRERGFSKPILTGDNRADGGKGAMASERRGGILLLLLCVFSCVKLGRNLVDERRREPRWDTGCLLHKVDYYYYLHAIVMSVKGVGADRKQPKASSGAKNWWCWAQITIWWL